MAVNKTSLSAGEVIRDLLTNDIEVSNRVNKVFPIVEDNATLPYVLYRRISLEQTPTTHIGADTVGIEILCFTSKYTDGIELAEAVRGALDNKKGSVEGLEMRSCYLIDSEEAWENDAYVQSLIFKIKL